MVRYYHLELLACPECRNYRLYIHSLKESKQDFNEKEADKLKCRRWCYLYDKPASLIPLSTCVRTCMNRDIEEGVIVCPSCGRWYPIVNSIPVMMNDRYRDEKRDIEFIDRTKDRIPDWLKELMKNPIPYISRQVK